MYVLVDKILNFYKMNVSDYKILLKKNIEKEYKKVFDNVEMYINIEGKVFV